jgi:hypothetical protein
MIALYGMVPSRREPFFGQLMSPWGAADYNEEAQPEVR